MFYVIRFIKGHLQITISGISKERFLNLCRNHHIYLWNISKISDQDKMVANIHLYDYFRILTILRKTGTQANVIHKYGLPFYYPFLRKKQLLFLSIMILSVYLCISSSYIWAFSIYGNQTITNEQIMDFLTEHQVKTGISKKDIPIHTLEMQFRDHFSMITWVSVQIKGTHCLIYIKENKHSINPSSTITYSNIISDKNGEIVSIITRKGVPKVKIGDQVSIGSVLVAGNVPVLDEGGEVIKEQYYDADADIMIKTKEHFHCSCNHVYQKKIFTGSQNTFITYQFQRHFICLNPFLHKHFKRYLTQTEQQQVTLFSEWYLPVYKNITTQKEYIIKEQEYSEKEVENILTEEVNKFILCLQEKGVQIIQKNVKINKNISISEVIADFVTLEPLCQKEIMKRE